MDIAYAVFPGKGDDVVRLGGGYPSANYAKGGSLMGAAGDDTLDVNAIGRSKVFANGWGGTDQLAAGDR